MFTLQQTNNTYEIFIFTIKTKKISQQAMIFWKFHIYHGRNDKLRPQKGGERCIGSYSISVLHLVSSSGLNDMLLPW